ncbi:MAG: ATP-dependent helicase [Deltaproteobacteria bacterium]|jgi:DNA helicase-2/ATP-dependent DNA helicase PcrA
MLSLTKEQRDAVSASGHVAVDACPGSGKTRAVVARIIHAVEGLGRGPRRVGCITYTNAAVWEIQRRLRDFGLGDAIERCDIATIHAFGMQQILRYYHALVKPYAAGFSVVTLDDEAFIESANEACRRHRIRPNARSIANALRASDGSPLLPQKMLWLRDAVAEFWRLLEAQGLIDFPSVVYRTYQILRDYPEIARAVACRYESIIVDEFQDTSRLQVEILRLIAQHGGTRFLLVGDPNQSIYGFAGARPELMRAFARELKIKRAFPFSGNFRSNEGVLDDAESLLPRAKSMQAVGKHKDCPIRPRHIATDDVVASVINDFLPAAETAGVQYRHMAVLAPAWHHLRPIGRALQAEGIPITGAGSRPYRRSNLIATLAEEAGAFVESIGESRFVERFDRVLENMVAEVVGGLPREKGSWSWQRLVHRLLKHAKASRAIDHMAKPWLERFARDSETELAAFGYPQFLDAKILRQATRELLSSMQSDVDVSRMTVRDFGVFARPDESIKLLSIHAAKGREFEAVALVGVFDGSLPYFKEGRAPDDIEEDRRKLYVAITRAKRVLFYIVANHQPRSRLLRELRSFPASEASK